MIDSKAEILRRRLRAAFRTVTLGYREYLPFFVCIFAILFALLTFSMSVSSGYASEEAEITDSYDYHVSVKGLNQSQMISIRDDVLTVFLNDYVYKCVSVEKHTSSVSKTESYDVYLYLLTGNKDYGIWGLFRSDSLKTNYKAFLDRYSYIIFPDGEENSSVSITTSPLYDLEWHQTKSLIIQIAILCLISFISTIILSSVYNIRINNQKFIYGIYSTFGADRRRLCRSSALEIIMCGALMLLPALAASIICCNVIYSSSSFHFSLLSVLLAVLFAIPVILLSVYIPIRSLPLNETISMISAQDNSNLVSRPKRSTDILKLKFPSSYEFLTIRRYKRRHFSLICLTSLFCAIFVSGIYLSDLYSANARLKALTSSDFTVSFNSEIPPDIKESIKNISGVRAVYESYSFSEAPLLASHILVSGDDASPLSHLHRYALDRDYIISNDVTYISASDGDVISMMCELYDVEGDPYSVLTNDRTIIIGDSVNNQSVYKFSVGDTVRVGIIIIPKPDEADEEENMTSDTSETTSSPDETSHTDTGSEGSESIETSPDTSASEETSTPDVTSEDIYTEASPETTSASEVLEIWASEGNQLDYLVRNFDFEYITCTIGAIIHGYPSALNRTPVILNADTYVYVSGDESVSDTLNIYLDSGLSGSDIDSIEFQIRDIAQAYRGTTVDVSGTYYDAITEANKKYSSLINVSSSTVLILIPVIWFFSQILFYKRRWGEFDILISLSANEKNIRALHLCGGLILGVGALLALPVSALCMYGIYCAATYWIPSAFNIGSEIVVPIQFSIITYIICFALTLLCSTLASVIPYCIYRKRKKSDAPDSILSVDE